MKALLMKASDWGFYKNIEINDLHDLLLLYGRLIIEKDPETLKFYRKESINHGCDDDYEIIITIYDDYVE